MEESGTISPPERGTSLNCLQRLINHLLKKESHLDCTNEKLLELLKPTRYKPVSVEQMAENTKFSKEEVKTLYRAFKQECPTAILDEDTFKEVFAKLYPLGESSKYAKLVFNTIDRESSGGITFGDFMGSEEEKIMWSFKFYDINKDGIISRDEMTKVTDSIYDLVGAEVHPRVKSQNVEKVFTSMDTNKDGVVSLEEFLVYCSSSNRVQQSLAVLP